MIVRGGKERLVVALRGCEVFFGRGEQGHRRGGRSSGGSGRWRGKGFAVDMLGGWERRVVVAMGDFFFIIFFI